MAPTHATVLLTGETETGKGLLATAIHDASDRARGRFVAVNCGALPATLIESELFGHERGAFTGALSRRQGKFEAASGGTLFLDEIDALGAAAQVGLLRVLQERRLERVGGNETVALDVRIVAASNKELLREVRAGHFREDLFYRLNVVPIHLPPLRNRPDDVERLARHFVAAHAASLGRPACAEIAPHILTALCAHAWPGNIRELENVIMRALILGVGRVLERVDLGDLAVAPAARPGADTFDVSAPLHEIRRSALDAAEAAYLHDLLSLVAGDVDRAARHAQLSRRMLYQLLRRHGIRPGDYREGPRPTLGPGTNCKEDPRCSA